MKKQISLIAATLAATTLMTTPAATAQSHEGRLLTMEDVVLNRDLTPKSHPVRWIGESDSYASVDDGALIATDVRTGKRRTLMTLDELNALLSTDFKTFPPYAFDDAASLAVAAHGMRNVIDPSGPTSRARAAREAHTPTRATIISIASSTAANAP